MEREFRVFSLGVSLSLFAFLFPCSIFKKNFEAKVKEKGCKRVDSGLGWRWWRTLWKSFISFHFFFFSFSFHFFFVFSFFRFFLFIFFSSPFLAHPCHPQCREDRKEKRLHLPVDQSRGQGRLKGLTSLHFLSLSRFSDRHRTFTR